MSGEWETGEFKKICHKNCIACFFLPNFQWHMET